MNYTFEIVTFSNVPFWSPNCKNSSSRCFGQIQIQSTIFLFRPCLGWVPGICWCIWKYCILLSPCILFTSLIFGTCSCCQLQGKLEKYRNMLPNQQSTKVWGSKINHFCLWCLYIPLTSAELYRCAWKFSRRRIKLSIFSLKRSAVFWNELHCSSAQFLVYPYQGSTWNPTPGLIILNCSPVTLVTIKVTSWVIFLVTKTDILLELVNNCYSLQEYSNCLWHSIYQITLKSCLRQTVPFRLHYYRKLIPDTCSNPNEQEHFHHLNYPF